MAKSSDIIKIGFDYRASLEQFEKETNGVFDGISEKAGKQRISIQLDAKNDKVIEKIKELQKLKLDKFTFEFGESGLAEQLKTFDQLEKKINEIINLSKGINNIGSGNGIGNSIVNEKSLNSIIDLFGKMESHLGEMKKVFADVGDGEEFSPLLKMINNVQESVGKLSSSAKNIGLNMNIEVGSNKELETKFQEKASKALIAYQRLFDHIKSTTTSQSVFEAFNKFNLDDFDTTYGKAKAIADFIERARNDSKLLYNGHDVLKEDTTATYWNQASAAMGQATKVLKEMKASSNTNTLENLFGKTDLTEVVTQLNRIVEKLSEISSTASEFKNAFANGFNVSASVEEIEKLTSRVKELENELSKVKVSSASPVKTNISSPMKDTFQGDAKSSAESSATAIKEEAKAMEQVAENAEKASKGKEKFAKANKNVKASADASTGSIEKENSALDEKVWEKNLKVIQEYMDANTKLNKLNAKDKGTGKHASDIARQEKEVEKLRESALEARAALSSMVNPHEAPIDDWGKWVEAMEKFEQATKGSAESVAKLEDALRSARNAQLSSIDSTIDNGQSKYDDFSARKAQSDAYKNSLIELGETIERLRTLRASLSNTRAFTAEEQAQIDDLTQSVREYVKEIGRMSADEKGSNDISRFKLLDRIAEYMKKNTRMSREFKAELESLMDTLRTGGANVQTGDILTQFEKIKDRIRQAKQEGISFFDIFKNKAVYGFAARLAQYYLSFYDFIRYARYAVQSVIEFDTALTEMRKVSDESVSTLERLQKATFNLADGVGTTALELQKSIADFMRIGETLEDATKSAQDANVLFRVSEFDDVTQATDALVAMSAAYKDLEKSQINDVLNEIGNNYAISTDELASALQKSAATLSVAGNDIYEAAALVTAGNTVLQDADSVGTGLKMISLRILGTQEAKDELASLGENVDDFVVQTKSKIDQTVRNYTAVTSNGFKGISVLDDNGNYRSTYEILRDISDVYQEIIETDKKAGTNRGQALLEVLAGKNRSNVAASILQSPEILESAYESALNSAGSAQEELNKYLESADGKVQKLKNQLQEFWSVLLDSGTLKTIISSLTTILETATELVDTLGTLGTIGLGAGLFAGVKNFGKTYKCMVSNKSFVIVFEYALHA